MCWATCELHAARLCLCKHGISPAVILILTAFMHVVLHGLVPGQTVALPELYHCVGAGAAGSNSSESDSELRTHKRSPGARFSEWLGHWQSEYDVMDQNELMLQVLTSPVAVTTRCRQACISLRPYNGPLVQRLRL